MEALISLSILAIGVLGALGLLSASRREAELAARRGAEALAAQQVLERFMAGPAPDSALVARPVVSGRRIDVTIRVLPLAPGLVRLKAEARDAAAGRPLVVETIRRVP